MGAGGYQQLTSQVKLFSFGKLTLHITIRRPKYVFTFYLVIGFSFYVGKCQEFDRIFCVELNHSCRE